MQFGELLESKSWGQAAPTHNAISGFKESGVVPSDKAIPDYAFMTEDKTQEVGAENEPLEVSNIANVPTLQLNLKMKRIHC